MPPSSLTPIIPIHVLPGNCIFPLLYVWLFFPFHSMLYWGLVPIPNTALYSSTAPCQILLYIFYYVFLVNFLFSKSLTPWCYACFCVHPILYRSSVSLGCLQEMWSLCTTLCMTRASWGKTCLTRLSFKGLHAVYGSL